MEIAKKSLLFFLMLLVIGGSAYGGFYFLKKYFFNTSTEKSSQVPETSSSVDIPGFKRDVYNDIPDFFPKDIILEKDVQVIESYEQKTSTTHEGTYRYVSKLSVDQAYGLYLKYLTTNGYANISGNRQDNYAYGFFQTPTGMTITVNVSYIRSTNLTVVDISMIKKILK